VQHGHIRDHILSKWLTVSKKIKNYTFQSVDEEQEWSCCEAWMVFGKSGYLDDKGQCAPLSRARMFESAAAAIRTVKSKKWTSWKVVKARVEAVGLEKFPGDTEDDRLSGAMARQEEKKLMAALENASIEQLKERLSALEGPSHMEADEVKKSTRARL
jgi:predicted NAD-dependent protein-ADP-ribosyltransferase YbiA (DUF1768 family)